MRKSRMRIVAATTVVLATLLTGCDGKIRSGEVIDKDYIPAHTSMVVVPIVVSNGKTSHTIMTPFTYYYNDNFLITIGNYDDEGEYRTAVYRVTEDVFDAVEVGYEFEYHKDMKPSYPEYVREKCMDESQGGS